MSTQRALAKLRTDILRILNMAHTGHNEPVATTDFLISEVVQIILCAEDEAIRNAFVAGRSQGIMETITALKNNS